jgi:hypothetical protein
MVDLGGIHSTQIPNTLRDLYTHYPALLKRVQTLMPDDYYLKIQEAISEPDTKETKVLSFIGLLVYLSTFIGNVYKVQYTSILLEVHTFTNTLQLISR